MRNVFDVVLYSLNYHAADWRQEENKDFVVRDDNLRVKYNIFERAWVISYTCTYKEWKRELNVPKRYHRKFEKAVTGLGERQTMADFMGAGR